MGTKSLPGQRHPNGVPWVHSAFGAGGPRFETQAGNPISGPLPFRGDSLDTKKGARELGLNSVKELKLVNPLHRIFKSIKKKKKKKKKETKQKQKLKTVFSFS